MPTYLPIKVNRRSSHRARARHKLPARSKVTGKFLKRGSAHRSKARRRNTPAKFHLGRKVGAHTWLRANARGSRGGGTWHSRGYTSGQRRALGLRPYRKGKHRAGSWRKGWAKKLRTTHRGAARGFKRRRNTGFGLARYNRPRYRTRHVVVHKTRRLRNPFGFDVLDGFGTAGTWGKIGLGVLFGLGGLVVAFGIPKALAVVTGKDAFQRGWGGVATSAVASVGVGVLVGLASKRMGLALITAAGVGVGLLVLNALHPASAQTVIPVNEAVLAAMLPTMGGGERDLSNVPGALPGINAYGLPMGVHPGRQGAADYHQGGFHGQKGPADYYPATQNTKSALTSTAGSYYGNPLKTKERF